MHRMICVQCIVFVLCGKAETYNKSMVENNWKSDYIVLMFPAVVIVIGHATHPFQYKSLCVSNQISTP